MAKLYLTDAVLLSLSCLAGMINFKYYTDRIDNLLLLVVNVEIGISNYVNTSLVMMSIPY